MCYSGLLQAVVPIAANRAISSSKKKRNSQLHSSPLHSEINSCGRLFGPCVWLKRSRILYGELAVMPCPQRRSLQGELSLLTQSVTGAVLLLKTLWSCSEVDIVWADQSLWEFHWSTNFENIKMLVSWLIEEGKQLELFAYTAWSVWNQ